MKQLTHQEAENEQKRFPITIVCDAIRTPENIGMCFRIAESFGVEKIYLNADSIDLDNRKVKRTARNTLTRVEHAFYSDFDTLISQLKKDGLCIVGLEITDDSTNIQDYDFRRQQKIGLVIGSERNGITSISSIDQTVAIPMFGSNSSMNVINSLAIALYEITNQLNLK